MGTPSTHAYLSASSSYRWLNCPPIVALEQNYPNKNTVYTLEGTAAHALAEIKLQYATGKIKTKRTFNKRLNEFKEFDSDFYNEEMDEAMDLYVETVIEHLNRYDNADIEFEQRVDFSRWVPDGFGTSDVVILTEDVIEIIDLKYGKGVPVYAHLNPQMMLYALGAYAKYDIVYEFKTIRMTIMQPRLDNVSTFELSVEELLYWADNYVAPRAIQATEGIGDWDITADSMKFSPVRAQLVPRAAKHFELIDRLDYKAPELLSDEEIGEVLEQADDIKKWLTDIEYYAMGAIQKGKTIPGYKLVEGRSNRKIVDEQQAAKVLEEKGYTDIYKEPSLLAIGKLEKLIGKNNFSELLGDLIQKPTGKPTLAPVSDKRPAIGSTESASDDFSDLVE